MRRLLKEIGICDVQTEINPPVKDSTLVSTLHSTDSRIDDFFMYNKDLGRTGSCMTGPCLHGAAYEQ